jgi:autotransporter-associated beta strand protein
MPLGALPSRRFGRNYRPTLDVLEDRLTPATHTWTGASTVSPFWSDAANWSGGAPGAGESGVALIFPSALQMVNFNDITGLTVASVQLTAPNYILSGEAITLIGDTTVAAANTSGQNTLNLTLNQQPFFGGTFAFFDHVYDVAGGGTLIVASQITGAPVANSVHKTGAGTLVLDNAGNDYGGTTLIDAGTLAQGIANAAPPNPCIVAQGATFDMGEFDASLGSLSGAGTVSTPPAPVVPSRLTIGLNNSDTTFSGTITGSINLVKAGTGRFTLGAISTYTGSTTVQAGTLAQGIANAAPPNPCIVTQGATFDMGEFDASLGSLSGAGTVSIGLDPPTLTIGADNTSSTFSGVISGSGNLTKIGMGTLTLSGADTYTGQTSVLGGTLQVTGSLSANTSVSVASGASLTGTAVIASATVSGTSGNDTFTIDTTGVTMDGTAIVSTPYTTLTLIGVGGNDTFDVLGTIAGSTTILNAVSGANLFNIGSAANTLDPIQGSVTVNGIGANNTLNIYDQGTSSVQSYGVSATQVTRTPPPIPPNNPTQTINYFNMAFVNLYGGSGADFWNAYSTPTGTSTALYGGSSTNENEFAVEDAVNLLDEIHGPLAFHGGGIDFLEAIDSGNTVGQTYTLTSGMLQRIGMANITYDGMGEFVLATANNPYFGHSPNTVYFQSLGNVFAIVEVGTADTLTVGQNGSMAGIVGDLRIQDVVGQVPKQVTLDDSADTTAGTVTLGGGPSIGGYLVSGLEPHGYQGRGRIGLLLDPTTPVLIRTGAGNDAFSIDDLTGAPALALDAGAGTNTLDYSAYQGTVQAILPLGMATGFAGGIKNIENVTGGQGNSLLVGDANANVLIGGIARSIIIGGAGSDTITGGRSDNILIGGTTVWDANPVALQAIMQEWTNATLSFDIRVNALRKGISVGGQSYALDTSTVIKDSSPDILIGGPGQNWFFVDFDDVINMGAGPGPNDRITHV